MDLVNLLNLSSVICIISFLLKNNLGGVHDYSDDDIYLKKKDAFVSDLHLCSFWKSGLPTICLNPHWYPLGSNVSRRILFLYYMKKI